MKQKTVIVLVGLAVVAGAAALLVDGAGRGAGGGGAGGGAEAGAAPGALFPELGARVNDAATIAIKQEAATLTLKRVGEKWVIEEKGGYPAQFEKVREAVLSLSQLKGVEAKTSNPERFAEISVQDPGSAPVKEGKQQPRLVTVVGADGGALASLIVGEVKWGARPQVFVRKAGEKQSWLAEVSGGAPGARLNVPVTLTQWVAPEIANIARERVASVVLRHPALGEGGAPEVIVALKDGPAATGFTVRDIPAGRTLKTPNGGDALANAVSYLNLEDVASAAGMAAEFSEEKASIAEFRTFDGLVLAARLTTKDGKTWATFDASFDESTVPGPTMTPEDAGPEVAAAAEAKTKADAEKAEAVRKEAAELNAKLEGWAFLIPEWKARTFMTRWSDLLADAGG